MDKFEKWTFRFLVVSVTVAVFFAIAKFTEVGKLSAPLSSKAEKAILRESKSGKVDLGVWKKFQNLSSDLQGKHGVSFIELEVIEGGGIKGIFYIYPSPSRKI